MPKSTVTEFDPNALYPIPEDTLVPVELTACEQANVKFTYKRGDKAGQEGSFLKWEWTFLVTDGPYAGITFRGTTEPKVTNATEAEFLPLARPVIEALLGRPLAIGEEVDTDLYIGLKAQATVKHQEPRPRKNGDGAWYNVELDEIFPPYGANVTQPAVTGNVLPPEGQTNGGWGAPAEYDKPPY